MECTYVADEKKSQEGGRNGGKNKRGWLKKRSRGFRGWLSHGHTYFFVLTESEFSYYADEEQTKRKKCVHLCTNPKVLSCSKNEKTFFVFGSKVVLTLVAEKKEERDAWVSALMKSIACIKKESAVTNALSSELERLTRRFSGSKQRNIIHEHCGFMKKEGRGRIKTWKRRWFILHDCRIDYFADRPPDQNTSLAHTGMIQNPLGSIDINASSTVELSKKRPYCFVLQTLQEDARGKQKKDKLFMAPSCIEERGEWIDILRHVISNCQEQQKVSVNTSTASTEATNDIQADECMVKHEAIDEHVRDGDAVAVDHLSDDEATLKLTKPFTWNTIPTYENILHKKDYIPRLPRESSWHQVEFCCRCHNMQRKGDGEDDPEGILATAYPQQDEENDNKFILNVFMSPPLNGFIFDQNEMSLTDIVAELEFGALHWTGYHDVDMFGKITFASSAVVDVPIDGDRILTLTILKSKNESTSNVTIGKAHFAISQFVSARSKGKSLSLSLGKSKDNYIEVFSPDAQKELSLCTSMQINTTYGMIAQSFCLPPFAVNENGDQYALETAPFVMLREEMYESALSWQIPCAYLRLRRALICRKIISLRKSYEEMIEQGTIAEQNIFENALVLYAGYEKVLETMVTVYEKMYTIVPANAYKGQCIAQTFKKSTQKGVAAYRAVATNLHIQVCTWKMGDVFGNYDKISKHAPREYFPYVCITYGAPADHFGGFKNGGLLQRIRRLKHCKAVANSDQIIKLGLDELYNRFCKENNSLAIPFERDVIDGTRDMTLQDICDTEKESMEEPNWFFLDDEQTEQGPYPTSHMRAWYLCKSFTDSTYIRNDTEGEHTFRKIQEKFPMLGNSVFEHQKYPSKAQASSIASLPMESTLMEHIDTHDDYIQRYMEIEQRLDVTFSQALSALVACFSFNLELMAYHTPLRVQQLCEVGFLYGSESLLSTHSAELGMLEDMFVTIKSLHNVVFRLVGEEHIDQYHNKTLTELRMKRAKIHPNTDDFEEISNQIKELENEVQWKYIDDDNREQGPFSSEKMKHWYEAGFFNQESIVKRVICTERDNDTSKDNHKWEEGPFATVFQYFGFQAPFVDSNIYFVEKGKCFHSIGIAFEDFVLDDGTVEKNYVIHLKVPRHVFQVLPDRCRQGGIVRVYPCVYSMGINEMQSVANIQNYSHCQLQKMLNEDALDVFQKYMQRLEQLRSLTDISEEKLQHIKTAIEAFAKEVKNTKANSKNKYIILRAQYVLYSLHGGRSTSCKSAKDRTSMSCTFEEARQVIEEYRGAISGSKTMPRIPSEKVSSDPDIIKLANLLREHGVRLHNCHKNTGKRCYAFNKMIQRPQLPKIFRPPLSTSGTQKVES